MSWHLTLWTVGTFLGALALGALSMPPVAHPALPPPTARTSPCARTSVGIVRSSMGVILVSRRARNGCTRWVALNKG